MNAQTPARPPVARPQSNQGRWLRLAHAAWIVPALLTLSIAASCGGGGQSGPFVRLVLEPDAPVADPDSALDEAKQVIERRTEAFDLDVTVQSVGGGQIVIDVRDESVQEAIAAIGRTALLQFCEPLRDAAGNVATFTAGAVRYESQTCNPVRDDEGNISVTGGEAEGHPGAPAALRSARAGLMEPRIQQGRPKRLKGRLL